MKKYISSVVRTGRMPLVWAMTFLLAGCSAPQHRTVVSRSTLVAEPAPGRPVRIASGVACSYQGRVGPPSYRVRDVGKKGVPTLRPADATMLENIIHYVHSSTLRFAYVGGEFAVFDADDGPCFAGQYAVLSTRDCNMLYVPSDGYNEIFEGPGGCVGTPRPWIKHH